MSNRLQQGYPILQVTDKNLDRIETRINIKTILKVIILKKIW